MGTQLPCEEILAEIVSYLFDTNATQRLPLLLLNVCFSRPRMNSTSFAQLCVSRILHDLSAIRCSNSLPRRGTRALLWTDTLQCLLRLSLEPLPYSSAQLGTSPLRISQRNFIAKRLLWKLARRRGCPQKENVFW